MLQSSSRNHKLNSQNGMARTVVTPARGAAKETNELVLIQLFPERLSEKVHATIPKDIVGGFEITVFQRSLKE